MNCLEYHELLQRSLDGDASAGGPALDRHLAMCPSCRTLHAAAQRLGEGLRLLPAPALPPDLTQRIVVGVLHERRGRQHVRRLELITAVAASLVLVVYTGSLWRHSKVAPVVPGPVVQVEPPVLSAAPVSLQRQVEEAGLAVVSLTWRTADETVSQTRLFFPSIGLLPADTENPPRAETLLDPPVQSLREVGQGVSAGLEPVAVSARRAVNRFLHDLPPMP